MVMIKKIKNFASDVVAEMKKVSWPTKEQLRESTVVVIVVTIIITAITWLFDTVFTKIITALFS